MSTSLNNSQKVYPPLLLKDSMHSLLQNFFSFEKKLNVTAVLKGKNAPQFAQGIISSSSKFSSETTFPFFFLKKDVNKEKITQNKSVYKIKRNIRLPSSNSFYLFYRLMKIT